jgi:hypothetical protein
MLGMAEFTYMKLSLKRMLGASVAIPILGKGFRLIFGSKTACFS